MSGFCSPTGRARLTRFRSEAYQILSDTNTRAAYDKLGKDAMKRPEEGGEIDPQEIFGQIFGGGALRAHWLGLKADILQSGSMTM